MKGVFLGTGQFAPIQLEAWSRVGNASISAVFGRNEVAAQAIASRFDVARHGADLKQLIEKVRPAFADICTAVDSHFDCIRICADAGLPIVCQKPIASSLHESRECVTYCEAAGVRLMVHDNWRWQPWYREIKRLLRAGTLGVPRSIYQTLRTGDGLGPAPYPEQPHFRRMPRFLLLETAIHYLDTYRYLFGEPERIHCVTHRNNPAIAGEDQAVFMLHFPEGPVVIWDGNRALPTLHRRPPFNGTLRLEGSEATLDVDAFGGMQIHTPDGRTSAHRYEIPPGYRGGSVQAALAHFVECLNSGAEFETSGTDYLKTTELVFQAYESAASGQTLPLAP